MEKNNPFTESKKEVSSVKFDSPKETVKKEETLKEKHDKLVKAMEELRAGRNESDIPLSDPYWSAANAVKRLGA